MGKSLLDALTQINEEEEGYTTSYTRKSDSNNLQKACDAVDKLDENDIALLEKKLERRKERLQFLKEQKSDSRYFPE